MGEDRSTEEFFDATFREVGIAEFFRKNLHMLGYGGTIKSFTTAVHEFLTNSLDACEEAGVLPDITVKVLSRKGENHYQLVVRDNGPGIPIKYIDKVFGKMLAGTKFHRYIQSRGQQGIGAVGAILFGKITTGRPFRVATCTGDGVIHTLVMDLDLKRNTARVHETIKELVELEPENARGVRIEAFYKDVQYSRGSTGAYEYVRRTAIVNPHARITLVEPDGTTIEFPRTSETIPKKPKEIKPHPLGLSPDDLVQMAKQPGSYRKLSTVLINECSRVTNNTIGDLQEAVSVDMSMKPEVLTHNQAEDIVKAFRRIKLMAPPTDGLIPIGEEQIERSLREILKPNFIAVSVRRPTVYKGGVPFQVEVGMAFGGEAGHRVGSNEKLEVLRFANRAPLLFDAGGCVINKAVASVDWKRYGLRSIDEAPVSVFVNIISPHIPYTSTGKQAVAEEEEILIEIRNALMEAGRKIGRYLSGQRRGEELKTKRNTFLRYIPEVAEALAELTGGDAETYRAALEAAVDRKLRLMETGEAVDEEEEGGTPEEVDAPGDEDEEESTEVSDDDE